VGDVADGFMPSLNVWGVQALGWTAFNGTGRGVVVAPDTPGLLFAGLNDDEPQAAPERPRRSHSLTVSAALIVWHCSKGVVTVMRERRASDVGAAETLLGARQRVLEPHRAPRREE
jgi:hypothetical protein